MSVKILGIKALRHWRIKPARIPYEPTDEPADEPADDHSLRSKILRACTKPVKFMLGLWWIYLAIGLPITLVQLYELNDHVHRHARASSYQIETNGKTYRLMERNYFYYWFDNLGTFESLDEAKQYRDVMIQTAQGKLNVKAEKWIQVK